MRKMWILSEEGEARLRGGNGKRKERLERCIVVITVAVSVTDSQGLDKPHIDTVAVDHCPRSANQLIMISTTIESVVVTPAINPPRMIVPLSDLV